MVIDFWNIDQTDLTPEEIFNKIKEEYTQDFIENYKMWKELILGINNEVKNIMIDVDLSTDFFEELTFDDFCNDIFSILKKYIIKNENISQSDIPNIIFDLRSKLYIKNYEIYIKNKNSISSLKKSINKIVI